MSNHLNNDVKGSLAEKMSAAIDDQSSEFEIYQLLKAIESGDDGLMEQWQQQHETKDVLEGVEVNVDLSASIMAKVALTEQTSEVANHKPVQAANDVSTAHKKFRWSWVANAASVAAVAVFVVVFGNQSLDSADVSLQVAEADTQALQQQAAQQRLQGYINAHAQQASYAGGRAVVLTVVEQEEKVVGSNE